MEEEALVQRLEDRVQQYIEDHNRFKRTGRDDLAEERKLSAYEVVRIIRIIAGAERAKEMTKRLRKEGI
jgi:AraC-like DNA-binding protein